MSTGIHVSVEALNRPRSEVHTVPFVVPSDVPHYGPSGVPSDALLEAAIAVSFDTPPDVLFDG